MAESGDDEQKPGFKVTDRRRAGREEEGPAQPAAKAPAGAPPMMPRPPIDFTTFVLSLGSTALIQMGAAPDPDTRQVSSQPQFARETIDLLGMLREKTRGNLTEEESKFLAALLYDLRMRFLELTGQKS